MKMQVVTIIIGFLLVFLTMIPPGKSVKCYVCSEDPAMSDKRARFYQASCRGNLGQDKQVDCPLGCVGVLTVRLNGQRTYERSCANKKIEENLLDSDRSLGKHEVFCNKIILEIEDKEGGDLRNYYKDRKKNLPDTHTYCVCNYNLCNGMAMNENLRSGHGKSKGQTGPRAELKLVLILSFLILWLAGPVDCVVSSCVMCTERTHKNCLEGGGDTDQCTNYDHSEDKENTVFDGCMKLKTCYSGYPCGIWRGCAHIDLMSCLSASDVELLPTEDDEHKSQECGKDVLKLNSVKGSVTAICLNDLKDMFERKWEKDYGSKLLPRAEKRKTKKSDDTDVIDDKSSGMTKITLEHCYCTTNSCNDARSWKKASIWVIIGVSIGLQSCFTHFLTRNLE